MFDMGKEVATPNSQFSPICAQSCSAKATRGRVRTPKAPRRKSLLQWISHEVLLECDASSHRFHSLLVTPLRSVSIARTPLAIQPFFPDAGAGKQTAGSAVLVRTRNNKQAGPRKAAQTRLTFCCWSSV